MTSVNSRHRLLLVAMLLAAAFLLLPTIVVACAIPLKPTVLEAYANSDVVIIARAISVERLSEMAPSGTFVSSTTMEVKKVFKGNLRVGDKMVFGQGNGIPCTGVFYDDVVGEEFLFYLDSPPADEKLWYEFGFGRSQGLGPAATDDLLYLNNIDKVRRRTRISGVLDDGGFEADTYLLIFSHENNTTKGTPFPKLYFPGVPEREKATPITVRHGESVKNLRVVIKK